MTWEEKEKLQGENTQKRFINFSRTTFTQKQDFLRAPVSWTVNTKTTYGTGEDK